jgi:antitoxin YefM
MAMRTINFSEARNTLKDVFDHVIEDDDVTIITRRDADDVVVMSLAVYNSWQETMHLLSSPANAQRLNESIAQARAGHVVYPPLPQRQSYAVHEPDPPPYAVRAKAPRPKNKPRKSR